MSRSRACWAILLILIVSVLGSNACTKRIAVEGAQFEATQNVLLSLTNDRSLRGKIGPGQRVEYRDHGALYRARVAKVTADTIALESVLLLDREDYEMVSRRLADARVGDAGGDAAVIIPRSQVEKVELVKVDAFRTARGLAFWTYGSAMFLKFLGDRS